MFEARIACPGVAASSAAKTSRLSVDPLGHGLDHQVDVAEALEAGRGAHQRARAVELRLRLLGARAAGRDETVELAAQDGLRPIEPGVDERGVDVRENDGHACRGDHRGDLGTHRAGADDRRLEDEHAQLLGIGSV